MKETLILIGGGGHCRSCIDVIEQEGSYAIAGILDNAELPGKTVFNYPIIGTDEEIAKLARNHYFLVAVGQIKSPATRIIIYGKLKEAAAKIVTIVSPRAYFSSHARIGEGSIVMHGATVNAGATIGNNCIINSHALIEHHAVIHDHCHIATGAIINGGVRVEEETFIGSGVTTKQYITIGAKSFVTAGMNIYRDIPDLSRIKPA